MQHYLRVDRISSSRLAAYRDEPDDQPLKKTAPDAISVGLPVFDSSQFVHAY
jgi:hypothetical protein